MNHSKKLRPTQRVSRNHRSIHLLTQISFLHLIIIHHILRIPTQNDEVIARQKRINYDDLATVDPFSPAYEIPVSDQLFVIQSKIIRQLA